MVITQAAPRPKNNLLPEWYPVAVFLRDENGEVLGGLLGDIWAGWLHVRTLAVAAPVRKRGFGKELMKRAETYAIERGSTDAFLDTFSFEARPFYEKLGYRVFGTLENHPVGYQHYFMTKKLDSGKKRDDLGNCGLDLKTRRSDAGSR
jgi:ribosomal protein S18 acetylase RimI-like enzyme